MILPIELGGYGKNMENFIICRVLFEVSNGSR